MPAHQKRAPDLITDGCEPPCGCWELNSGPLEKQLVLLPTESSLQPPAPRKTKQNIVIGILCLYFLIPQNVVAENHLFFTVQVNFLINFIKKFIRLGVVGIPVILLFRKQRQEEHWKFEAMYAIRFLCNFGACPGTRPVDQAGLELTEIRLPLPPKCWD